MKLCRFHMNWMLICWCLVVCIILIFINFRYLILSFSWCLFFCCFAFISFFWNWKSDFFVGRFQVGMSDWMFRAEKWQKNRKNSHIYLAVPINSGSDKRKPLKLPPKLIRPLNQSISWFSKNLNSPEFHIHKFPHWASSAFQFDFWSKHSTLIHFSLLVNNTERWQRG